MSHVPRPGLRGSEREHPVPAPPPPAASGLLFSQPPPAVPPFSCGSGENHGIAIITPAQCPGLDGCCPGSSHPEGSQLQ